MSDSVKGRKPRNQIPSMGVYLAKRGIVTAVLDRDRGIRVDRTAKREHDGAPTGGPVVSVGQLRAVSPTMDQLAVPRQRYDRGLTVVALDGRLDAAGSAQARQRLHEAVELGTGQFVVDLSEVELVDVTGLGVLIGTHRLASRAGRTMVLRGTRPRVERLLRAIGLDRVLRTEPARTDAAVRPAKQAAISAA